MRKFRAIQVPAAGATFQLVEKAVPQPGRVINSWRLSLQASERSAAACQLLEQAPDRLQPVTAQERGLVQALFLGGVCPTTEAVI